VADLDLSRRPTAPLPVFIVKFLSARVFHSVPRGSRQTVDAHYSNHHHSPSPASVTFLVPLMMYRAASSASLLSKMFPPFTPRKYSVSTWNFSAIVLSISLKEIIQLDPENPLPELRLP
jgi:hypothetical protein